MPNMTLSCSLRMEDYNELLRRKEESGFSGSLSGYVKTRLGFSCDPLRKKEDLRAGEKEHDAR